MANAGEARRRGAYRVVLICFALGVSVSCGPGERGPSLDPVSQQQTVHEVGHRQATLAVVGPDGLPLTEGYRWQLEEDVTWNVVPGDPTTSFGVEFHKSYMPLLDKGHATGPVTLDLEEGKRYFVSVLPDSGYAMGGAAISLTQSEVTVVVNPMPIPTAQITVFVFEDNQPINNAPDLPQELGLGGFQLRVVDAAGRYGQPGGHMMLDAFGNPLGTTYFPDGSVDQMGDSIIRTDASGRAVIKNLAPGKYTIEAVPPVGEGWVQTTTIEGGKGQDAWVKANEPPYFREFGPPGEHVFIGFVRPTHDAAALDGDTTVSGRVVNLHMSRPPDTTLHAGAPFVHTTPWVGLNDLAAGLGQGIYAQRCEADGSFSIPNVPPGNYQLVVWDDYLDVIIAFLGVTVPPGGGDIVIGDLPVFQWFTRLEHYVFYDSDGDGYRDPDEPGIPEQAVNLRFRDGTVYQSFPTDRDGYVPFDQVFPFFHWLVAEVDFLRFKATGVTVTVDNGGAIDPTDPRSFGGVLSPQPQPDNAGLPYRTEVGPVLTQGFQGFLGQTSVLEWGKAAYGPGENGGISGIVFYATTRAEDDPRYAAAEEWEPGVPRVQVNLYLDDDEDGEVDDLNGDGAPTYADVDNPPFGNFPGDEDVDHAGNGVFDAGDAIQITTTDSWDDNLPTGCPGDPADPFYLGARCYDGLRNWNQVRPAVFDGGYAFTSYFPGGIDSGSTEVEVLPAGNYIVEVAPPRGYEILKEEDRNVDFGEEYTPGLLLLPPLCVGDDHVVPPELSLFPGVPTPMAGQTRPLCDRKQVPLRDGMNAAADFFVFTEVPVSGHVVGFILDDTANELDPSSPQFGEKYAPPWLPVSIRDWTGREIARTYSDHTGKYNALVPSTFTTNLPMASGMSPNMLTLCMNDPGPIADPADPTQLIEDPYFNRQYSQFCYTFQFMPGTTTYLDTPVVRIAAFAGPDQFPLDCELEDGTPKLYSVSGPSGGPWVGDAGGRVLLVSEGDVEVLNPAYDGSAASPRTLLRDYGFGSIEGTVALDGAPLTIVSWTPGVVEVEVPAGASTGQLEVTRGDTGRSTVNAVTLTVGGSLPVHVPPGATVQSVIDAAAPGDLVLVPPGSYEESLILWKPLRLQGWGPGSTILRATNEPAEARAAWRAHVEAILASGEAQLLPSQETGTGGFEPITLFTEEGAGVLVLAKDAPVADGGFGLVGGEPNARVDGFTITGSDFGGGVVVNGYARYFEVGNNRVSNNYGIYSGGVRIGHPFLVREVGGGLEYEDAENDSVRVHHNLITQNGGMNGAGAGVSIHTGADLYEVTDNFICGNFGMGEGGGIGHLGLSDDGIIANNRIVFNQTFNQGQTVSGGGVLIAGGDPLGGVGSLSPGSGSVRLVSNLIQSNQAGAGDGGGIRLARVNGADVASAPNDPLRWFSVAVLNNMIVNNMAGLAGGGVSLQDVARSYFINNTIAHNDSTATAGEAFVLGDPDQSRPQPAGLVSRAHSDALANAFGTSPLVNRYRRFSSPRLVNNIVWENRSFYFQAVPGGTPPFTLLPDVAAGDLPVFWDLDVLGTATPAALDPQFCLLTDPTGYAATNIGDDPGFVAEYFNGARNSIVLPEVTTGIQAPPALDEGGNFIDVIFGPLSLTDPATGLPFGDYHLAGAGAVDEGSELILLLFPDLELDFDGEPRPVGASADIGADEQQ